MYWNHQTSWNHTKYFFMSLFLSVCFHAVKGILLEPTYILFKWPYIHPTENLISMNFLQMSCVITWAWWFLTSDVQRLKTSYLNAHFECSVHPSAPVLLIKDLPRNEISYDFQPPFSLHISNSRTKPAGLDF